MPNVAKVLSGLDPVDTVSFNGRKGIVRLFLGLHFQQVCFTGPMNAYVEWTRSKLPMYSYTYGDGDWFTETVFKHVWPVVRSWCAELDKRKEWIGFETGCFFCLGAMFFISLDAIETTTGPPVFDVVILHSKDGSTAVNGRHK